MTPCDQPHVLETYATFSLGGEAYPGEETVLRLADGGCLKRFKEYVGEPYAVSLIEMVVLYPASEDEWHADDRVICLLTDGNTRRGSLRGWAYLTDIVPPGSTV